VTPRPQQRIAPSAGTAVPPKVLAALRRYRVAAFIVGWGLIILCATMVAKYAFGQDWTVAVWGPIHGVLYVGYVLLAFDLAYKDRWSLGGTVWVLLAGVIPGVSFVAERQVHRKVLARQKI
jgi:integral membrane protein